MTRHSGRRRRMSSPDRPRSDADKYGADRQERRRHGAIIRTGPPATAGGPVRQAGGRKMHRVKTGPDSDIMDGDLQPQDGIMSGTSVLLVEDEKNIASFIAMYLRKEGFMVETAGSGSEGIVRAGKMTPQLIILDIMLPDMDGFEVCRRLRRESDVPIIMLTARDAPTDKVVGLELGADDYMTKPFDPRELVARVKSVLRRVNPQAREVSSPVTAGGITLDPGRHEVSAGGGDVKLTGKEFDLLHYLMLNAGLALSRQQLLQQVWGYDFAGDTRTVDVHINQLRKKLGGNAGIETVRGIGYKFVG